MTSDVSRPYKPRPAQCVIDGCEQKVLARGWCNKHYERWRQHGDPLIVLQEKAPRDGPCSVDGCDAPIRSRRLCNMHYQRWKKWGDPTYLDKTDSWDGIVCSIDGCDNPAKSRGWCNKHYTCWFRNGSPVATRPLLEDPGYGGMHARVQKVRTGKCSASQCSHTGRTEMALRHGRGDRVGAEGTPWAGRRYSTTLADYIELCARCHSRYDNYHPELVMLKWWKLHGTYASALVAAETPERAIDLMKGHSWESSGPWYVMDMDDEGDPLPDATCPGPPTAEGVYHAYGE